MLVNVGAVPPGHLTDAGQVTARAVPSAVNCKTRLYTTVPAGKLLKLNVVMLAFKLTVNTFAVFNDSVNVPALIVGELFVSVYTTAFKVPATVSESSVFSMFASLRYRFTSVPNPMPPALVVWEVNCNLPSSASVVNAPVERVVAPMAVLLMPLAVMNTALVAVVPPVEATAMTIWEPAAVLVNDSVASAKMRAGDMWVLPPLC